MEHPDFIVHSFVENFIGPKGLNMHVQLSSGTEGHNFCLSHHICSFFDGVSNEGFGYLMQDCADVHESSLLAHNIS